MGVAKLWNALEKGDAVTKIDGSQLEVAAEVEGKVVAVDLAVWLVQATTQPALYENYASPQAACLKVVFDRTIHWLRYGCLPVYVMEGVSPPEKLERLRARAVAMGGNGNRGTSNRRPFSHLTTPVKELLDAMGVPYYEAPGEGEAACAALNICGWAHGCHSLDVDALLFGAQTVYRQLALHTSKPADTRVTKCTAQAVCSTLGIRGSGRDALIAVAQLAGGDYDVQGAERVGEELSMFAVRSLLRGCQTDAGVLEALERAVAAGSDPSLDALTQCTGCKCCGHEGGRKGSIKTHGRTGCAQCGTDTGCTLRAAGAPCQCAFHARQPERVLNRVVRRAALTPGFLDSCRRAKAAYHDQTRQAVGAVSTAFGIADTGLAQAHPFAWSRRPDVRAIAAIMARYIEDWDYNQVRLKLLPLLLEWDVRQGPAPPPSAGVQFRPSAIKAASKVGAAKAGAAAASSQQQQQQPAPWRYILAVERVNQEAGRQLPGSPGRAVAEQAAEDAAIDAAWLAGTARSRPAAPRPASSQQPPSPFKQLDLLTAGEPPGDGDEDAADELLSQASGGGRKAAGTLSFGEHRSVRSSLLAALWPHLMQEYAERLAGGGASRRRAASGGAASGRGRAGSGAGSGASSGARVGRPQVGSRPAGQAALTHFFSPRKAAQGAAGSASATAATAGPAVASPSQGSSAGWGRSEAQLRSPMLPPLAGTGTPSSKGPRGGAGQGADGYIAPWLRHGRQQEQLLAAPAAGPGCGVRLGPEGDATRGAAQQLHSGQQLGRAYHAASRASGGNTGAGATVFTGDLACAPATSEPAPLAERLRQRTARQRQPEPLGQSQGQAQQPVSGAAAAAAAAAGGTGGGAPAAQVQRKTSPYFDLVSSSDSDSDSDSGPPAAQLQSPAKRTRTTPAAARPGSQPEQPQRPRDGSPPPASGAAPSWMHPHYADMLRDSGCALQGGASPNPGGRQQPPAAGGSKRSLFRQPAGAAQARPDDCIDLTSD